MGTRKQRCTKMAPVAFQPALPRRTSFEKDIPCIILCTNMQPDGKLCAWEIIQRYQRCIESRKVHNHSSCLRALKDSPWTCCIVSWKVNCHIFVSQDSEGHGYLWFFGSINTHIDRVMITMPPPLCIASCNVKCHSFISRVREEGKYVVFPDVS